MKINVHVKEKTITVQCGEGKQRVIWLAHVGIARYDSNFGLELGVPKGVQQDDGKILDPNAIIKDTVIDNQHLWVLLKDDAPVAKIPQSMMHHFQTQGSKQAPLENVQ